jgi:DNA-binding ferritin-like protein (Dps family)
VVFSAAVLAFCVIITSLVWVVGLQRDKMASTSEYLTLGAVLVCSLASVGIVYVLRVRTTRYEKLLNQEFLREYQLVKESLGGSTLSSYQKKEVLEDVLDLLVSAQRDGKAVGAVVVDPVAFAQDIIASYLKPTRAAVLRFCDSILAFVLFTLGLQLVLWVENRGNGFFNIGMDTSMVLLLGLVSFLVLPLTKGLATKRNPWLYLFPVAFGVVYVLLAELSRKNLYHLVWVRTWLDGTIKIIPSARVLVVFLAAIPGLILIKQLLRRHLRA